MDESEAECKGVEKRGWSLVTMRSAGGGWGHSESFRGSRRGRRRSTGDADGGEQRERRLRAGTSEVRCCALIALIAHDRPCSFYRGAPTLLVSRDTASTTSNDSGDTGPENRSLRQNRPISVSISVYLHKCNMKMRVVK